MNNQFRNYLLKKKKKRIIRIKDCGHILNNAKKKNNTTVEAFYERTMKLAVLFFGRWPEDTTLAFVTGGITVLSEKSMNEVKKM